MIQTDLFNQAEEDDGKGAKEQEPCPVCGSGVRFVPEYEDSYCWECGKYASDLGEVAFS